MIFAHWRSADTKEKLDKLADDIIEEAAETYQPELKDKVSKCKKKAIIEKSWKAVKTYMDDVSPMWKNQTPVGGGGALTLETLQKAANSINSQANEALNIPTVSKGSFVGVMDKQFLALQQQAKEAAIKEMYLDGKPGAPITYKGKPFIANPYSTTTTITNTNTDNIYWPSATTEGYTTTFPDVGFTEPPSPKQPQTMEELYKGTSFDSSFNKDKK